MVCGGAGVLKQVREKGGRLLCEREGERAREKGEGVVGMKD